MVFVRRPSSIILSTPLSPLFPLMKTSRYCLLWSFQSYSPQKDALVEQYVLPSVHQLASFNAAAETLAGQLGHFKFYHDINSPSTSVMSCQFLQFRYSTNPDFARGPSHSPHTAPPPNQTYSFQFITTLDNHFYALKQSSFPSLS